MKQVYLFRPLGFPRNGCDNLLRYAGGKWIDDDGKPDLAFVHKSQPYVYMIDMPYKDNLLWTFRTGPECEGHPNKNPWHYVLSGGKKPRHWVGRNKHANVMAGSAAMTKCCKLHSVANGNGVDFNPSDKTMQAGLVWVFGGDVVTIPSQVKCYLCGKKFKF